MTKRKNPEDFLPTGRECSYTKEVGDRICDLVATHTIGYKRLMLMYPDIPDMTTMAAWRIRHPMFSSQYFEAKNQQALLLAEETLDICDLVPTYIDENGKEKIDTGMLGKARLQVATRQWHASKLQPKIYGDKKELEDLKEEHERIKQELDALRVDLDGKNKSEY